MQHLPAGSRGVAASPQGAGSKRNILLVWGDAKERRSLYKILCATGAEVAFADDPVMRAENITPYGLLVVDFDSGRDEAHKLLSMVDKLSQRPAVLVVMTTSNRDDLTEVMSHECLTNLIAKNTDLLANELVVTVQKVMRNDIFNFEKYLTWGAVAHECVLDDSSRKDAVLDELEEYLKRIGCNRRLIGLARGVGDEFIMNAIYNAPVDAQGRPKYASRSRAERVHLEANELVLFRYACDGRAFALSIRDNFGRLEKSTVKNYLQKGFRKGADQIDTKEGGAGLGLYYIFESLNHFVINVSPNKCTEMIGIMDISGSHKDFAERPKSLNVFIQQP